MHGMVLLPNTDTVEVHSYRMRCRAAPQRNTTQRNASLPVWTNLQYAHVDRKASAVYRTAYETSREERAPVRLVLSKLGGRCASKRAPWTSPSASRWESSPALNRAWPGTWSRPRTPPNGTRWHAVRSSTESCAFVTTAIAKRQRYDSSWYVV